MKTRPTLPPLMPEANKYTRGSLLIVAGSQRYYGAAVLATLAAEKTGAGYSSLVTLESVAVACRTHLLCSPVIAIPEYSDSGIASAQALSGILRRQRHIDALCCGSGLTPIVQTSFLVEEVLAYAAAQNIPLLLDADALNVIAQSASLRKGRIAGTGSGSALDTHTSSGSGTNTSSASDGCDQQHQKHQKRDKQAPLILTPHAGELARLLAAYGIVKHTFEKPGVREEDHTTRLTPSWEAAEELARLLDAVVVAKGPTTLVTNGEERTLLSEATPALARAGTGDVLSGIISSLLAQGMLAEEASVLGVRIHSKAGRLAEQELGSRSVTALDVVEAIPAAIRCFE